MRRILNLFRVAAGYRQRADDEEQQEEHEDREELEERDSLEEDDVNVDGRFPAIVDEGAQEPPPLVLKRPWRPQVPPPKLLRRVRKQRETTQTQTLNNPDGVDFTSLPVDIIQSIVLNMLLLSDLMSCAAINQRMRALFLRRNVVGQWCKQTLSQSLYSCSLLVPLVADDLEFGDPLLDVPPSSVESFLPYLRFLCGCRLLSFDHTVLRKYSGIYAFVCVRDFVLYRIPQQGRVVQLERVVITQRVDFGSSSDTASRDSRIQVLLGTMRLARVYNLHKRF
jgi:hypothetical protein